MELFDAHCHLDDPRLDVDREAVIARAEHAGISGFIVSGVDPPGWKRQRELAEQHASIYNTYGIHPWTVAHEDGEALEGMLQELETALAAPTGKPVALGELGLHKGGKVSENTLERQVEFFRAQLALAKDRDLPIVLHIVGAHAQALEILRKDGLPSRGGLVHSYSGPADAVNEYIELGLHLSFSGSITWPGARKAPLAVRATPSSRLLIETDSPDQTPEPHRPGRNEPAYLLQILDRVASLRGVPREELATLTTKNAHHLFEIHP